VAAIRRSAPVVRGHAERLTAALYEHFLAFPRSAELFLREDGAVDTERVDRRKHSLGRWLRESAEVAMTPEFSYYLLSIGLSHSHRAQESGGSVPPHLMIGAMSLAQTALTRLFESELERGEARAASVAWNKLLLVLSERSAPRLAPCRPGGSRERSPAGAKAVAAEVRGSSSRRWRPPESTPRATSPNRGGRAAPH